VTVRHSQNTQNDWYDSGPEMQQLHFDRFARKKWDSENIKENEDSVPEALPTYMTGQIDVAAGGRDSKGHVERFLFRKARDCSNHQ